MSQIIPSISDAFRTVTAATETALIANTSLNWGALPKKLYFMQGNMIEIMNVLQEYTDAPATKNAKYPLIALLRDIKETIEPGQYGLGTKFKCRILIFTITNPDYRADEREEKNFKPILIPIFEELIRQIGKSKVFGMPNAKSLEILKWDCYFYGTSQGKEAGDKAGKNPLNDYIDAIDVESLSLCLKNIC